MIWMQEPLHRVLQISLMVATPSQMAEFVKHEDGTSKLTCTIVQDELHTHRTQPHSPDVRE
jgi:hypothetical protein